MVRLKYSHPGTVHTDFDTASALNPTSFSVALAPSHTPGLQAERGLTRLQEQGSSFLGRFVSVLISCLSLNFTGCFSKFLFFFFLFFLCVCAWFLFVCLFCLAVYKSRNTYLICKCCSYTGKKGRGKKIIRDLFLPRKMQ